jgi:CO/xanthine dehydrogenase Mo-binding subunit
MVAPPAVVCAIEDALRPLGVRIDSLPATPARVRALICEAEARKGAR